MKKLKGKIFDSGLRVNICECGATVVSECYVKEEKLVAMGFCDCGNIFLAARPMNYNNCPCWMHHKPKP